MKKTNIGRSIEKLFLKIKIYLDFFTVISVLGILLYRIDALRKICRKIRTVEIDLKIVFLDIYVIQVYRVVF